MRQDRWEVGEGKDAGGFARRVIVEPVAITLWPDTRTLRCLNFPGVNSYFGGVQGGLVGLAKQLFIKPMKTNTCDVFCNICTLDPNLRYLIN